jgi:hypothetical protein
MPFTKRASTPMTTNVGGYWEYLPPGYNTGEQYPVIIGYHGIGKQGSGSSTDLESLKTEGISGVIWAYGGTFPYNAIVICPQYQGGYPIGSLFQNVINYVKANYSVNPNKIYLSGYSLGGAFVDNWGDVGTITDIAACVVVAGAAGYNQNVAHKYKSFQMPFWFLHGTADSVVPISRSRDQVNGLNAAPSIVPPAIITELPGAGHNIDQTVYDPFYTVGGKTVYDFMLQYDRSLGYGGGGGGGGTQQDVRIDVGGPSQTLNGQAWVGLDGAQVSGGVFTDVFSIWGADRTINGTTNQTIYKSARLGSNGFTISYPVANGNYTLRLHFCEFWRNSAGFNVFNVSVQGTQVLTNFDVWVTAGGRYNAYYQDFPVSITNGVLTITTTKITGDTMLNAFELLVSSNQPPTANAGSDQSITLPTNSVNLTGSGTDSDGTIASYLWSKQSGGAATITSPTAQNTSITGLVQGTYVFQLQVTDDDGATGVDTVTVIVNPAANVPPVANAGANQTITLPVNQVSLSGSASTDSDGTITGYAWTKLSGPSGNVILSPSSVNTDITFTTIGTYVFRLTVTDNSGASATDDLQIIVNPAPLPIYIKTVGRRIGIPSTNVTTSLVFDDGTTQLITNNAGSPVKTVSKRLQFINGDMRIVAYIWFQNGTTRIITQKGE